MDENEGANYKFFIISNYRGLCVEPNVADAKTSGYAPVNPAASETLPAHAHILQVTNQYDTAHALSKSSY